MYCGWKAGCISLHSRWNEKLSTNLFFIKTEKEINIITVSLSLARQLNRYSINHQKWVVINFFSSFQNVKDLIMPDNSQLCRKIINSVIYTSVCFAKPFEPVFDTKLFIVPGRTTTYMCILWSRVLKQSFISSTEPKAQGELLWPYTVRRRRRPSVRPSVCPSTIFKQHLLLNHWLDFDQTSQEWSLVGPLSKLFKWFWSIAYLGHRS